MRIKITGYYDLDDDQTDAADRTGMTSAAYDDLITGESGQSLTLMDLEDVDVEQAL